MLIECSLEEFKQTFVDSFGTKLRMEHYQRFLEYSRELKQMLNAPVLRQWIDGSFVTKEPNPKDIDLVTFVEYQEIKRLNNSMDKFKAPNAMETFGVDANSVGGLGGGYQEGRLHDSFACGKPI